MPRAERVTMIHYIAAAMAVIGAVRASQEKPESKMVEFKTQYGKIHIQPDAVTGVEMDGNLTIVTILLKDTNVEHKLVVSDSYSEAMRKLGRNV